jgi:hypothetical protein
MASEALLASISNHSPEKHSRAQSVILNGASPTNDYNNLVTTEEGGKVFSK